MAPLFLLLLISLLPLYLLSKIFISKSRRFNNPPGPPTLPFIGNLHQVHPSSLHTSLWHLSKSYGPIISLRFGFIPTVVVASASLATEVLKTQDIVFCSRPPLLGQLKLSYGRGLDVAFSPYNKNWRDMRKIFTLHLLGPKRVQSSRHIREDEVSITMKSIHGLAVSSKHVNLSEILKSMMSNLMLRMSVGKRYQDGHESKEVIRRVTELQAVMAELFVSNLWPGVPFVGLVDRLLGKMDRVEKCFKYFDSFYQKLIDEHLNDLRNPKSDGEEDVIDILLRLKKEQSFDLTYDHIKGMLMNVLVGGTDPVAATMVWAMTALIKNPKVMKKAQQEVRNVIGKKGKVDEDDLPKLAYLKAVVKETLRLYPPAPLLIPRETTKDTILHGFKIKPKTLVFVNALAIGRDPECWESPELFLPERFIDSAIDFKGNNFEFIPFGAGRRICPGISVGDVMVDLVLANLIYLFDWDFPSGMGKEDVDFAVLPGITMHKRNELCLLAHVNL